MKDFDSELAMKQAEAIEQHQGGEIVMRRIFDELMNVRHSTENIEEKPKQKRAARHGKSSKK